jgi:hypothetical protein
MAFRPSHLFLLGCFTETKARTKRKKSRARETGIGGAEFRLDMPQKFLVNPTTKKLSRTMEQFEAFRRDHFFSSS